MLPHMWREPLSSGTPPKVCQGCQPQYRRYVQLPNIVHHLQKEWPHHKESLLPSSRCLQNTHSQCSQQCHPCPLPHLMASVHMLFVNMCCQNAATHSLLNTNNKADIIMVQEPWYDKIGTTHSDTDPEGVNILGGMANPKWDCIYPKLNHGERCKVMAYRCISLTHFNITNHLDISSCHHILTLDVHLRSSSFQAINIYHDTNHQGVLNNILNIKINLPTPTIAGGDFNTHSQSWSPPGICPSPWVNRVEDWAIGQSLALASPPGAPTHRGGGNQQDTTIDLIWTNATAILDDTFQEPTIDFTASMGSDHAGL
jgi:hypothetical protein